MDPLAILSIVSAGIKAAQLLIDAGKSAAPIITAIHDRITNKPPEKVTKADLDAVAAISDQMTANILRPLDTD